ncbi:hypothetical protein [Motilimonas eburnea]|uniref:hypothetical protein n=1 Tax=Motilimonas eburnea TaxID=1737488 RepID=UPI001E4362CD|nr:hypothetical protein [Motilimonas eburnea]MCE2570263.1 hypothetical protein [Motilimonas eburnea]
MKKLTIVSWVVAFVFVSSASADNKSNQAEVAKELANPNTAFASLNIKLQYNDGYQGGGDNFTTVFQPSLPFPLENGDKVLFRPAISYIDNDFSENDKSGFSDISFDLAYAPNRSDNSIFAIGMIASLPTGSDEFSAKQLAIGPEVLFGKVSAERVVGIFPNHLVGVAGSGIDDGRVNKTSAQVFWTELLDQGWTMGSAPTFSYDWESDQAEIPINFSITKTSILGGRPWKVGIEANYYVEKAESTRPDFMIGFNITPVVENKLTALF